MAKRWIFGVPLVWAAWGCASAPPAALTPKDPTPLAKCSVAKSQASPLVTEWPASEKSHLESMLATQAVVVSYSGCEMRILDSCRLDGSYDFRRTTLSEDTLEIENADELYAKVPLGAASLEAELAASGRLAIHTTVVGQMRLAGDVVVPDSRGCEGATHVITAVSIGAFELLSGGALEAGGGVAVGSAGIGARHRREEAQLRSAGSREACLESDEEPHHDCQSPLQVFLSPAYRAEDLEHAKATAAPLPDESSFDASTEEPELAEARPEDTPEPLEVARSEPAAPPPPPRAKQPWDEPPRDASVEVHFSAPEAETDPGQWILLSPEGDVLCKLPCVRRVGPESGMRLQLDAPRKEDIKVIPLPDDLGYTPGRKVRAMPEVGGPSLLLPGLTLGIGGAALGGGIAMIAMSRGFIATDEEGNRTCKDSDSLCTAGTITAVVGGLTALVGGGWLWGAAGNPRHGTIDLTLMEDGSAAVRLELAPTGLVGYF